LNILCWNDPRANLKTTTDGVDIRYAWLDQGDPLFFENILSEDEMIRAKRYKTMDIRNRFVTGRGILRIVLGKFLAVEPTDVQISSTWFGKPVLTGFSNQSIDFNVSHSGNLMVIAISENQRVGIDLECVDWKIDAHAAASIVFSSEEIDYLHGNEYEPEMFYEIWTRKEAVLKTTGFGFSYPSTRFSVISSKPQSFLPWISGEVTKGNRCDIQHFSLFDDYSAALATINK
jgi:4'-phosphopantetheinyl transferase